MRLIYKTAITLIISFVSIIAHSQGCSDAGVCTVHSIKTIETEDSTSTVKNLLNTGVSIGEAQYNVLIVSPYLQYSRILSKKVTTTVKLIYSAHYGDLATIQNFSDIMATTNYKPTRAISMIWGVKIPLNTANKTKDGLPLPMAYQTSLGTTDAIAGISYSKRKYAVSFAYQQPLIQNKNQFFIEDYPENIINSKYKSTNKYFRTSDILIRLSHIHNFNNKKMILISSILPIYHIGNDSFVDKRNVRQEIEDSEGLTLNLNIFYQYKITKTKTIEFSLGAPVISRESRPDGLSLFALGIEYTLKF